MKWLVCECWTLFILSLETDWETTHLGHQVELEWRLKVFSRTSDLQFWIPPHQGTHSYSQILKLTYHILSFSNKVDLFNFFAVHIIRIFPIVHASILPMLCDFVWLFDYWLCGLKFVCLFLHTFIHIF